jgi:hypothetical protein
MVDVAYIYTHWDSDMKTAPIVLFVYNRPTHTRRTVEALLRNKLAVESDLFIYSDAPKQTTNKEAVQNVRDYIKTIAGFRSISIVERERNWGLANSIIDGVTEICRKYGRVIVVEDDLVVSPHFLEYMNVALNRYDGNAEVMQISGYMFPFSANDMQEDALFLPFITSWGWATWQQAWQHFDPSCAAWSEIKRDASAVKAFDLGGAYFYSPMIEAQLRGEIDSWAIRWYVSVFARKGLVLFPRHTLVHNSGLDGSGTHGKGPGAWIMNRPAEDFIVRTFPKEVAPSPMFRDVAAAMSQGRPSYFNLMSRWFNEIFANTQSRG